MSIDCVPVILRKSDTVCCSAASRTFSGLCFSGVLLGSRIVRPDAPPYLPFVLESKLGDIGLEGLFEGEGVVAILIDCCWLR